MNTRPRKANDVSSIIHGITRTCLYALFKSSIQNQSPGRANSAMVPSVSSFPSFGAAALSLMPKRASWITRTLAVPATVGGAGRPRAVTMIASRLVTALWSRNAAALSAGATSRHQAL